MSARIVLITGASSGIGAALATEWARQFPSDRLIIAARTVSALEELQAKIGRERSVVLPLDLEQPQSIASAVDALLASSIVPHVVIHNAGISQRSFAKDTSLEVDRRLMEVNYFGTVGLTKLLLPHFIRRGSGQFVIVSSLVGRFGSPMRSGYAASKHALHGFFDSLRAELASEHGPDAFPITILCPGFIHTPLPYRALTRDGTPQNHMDPATESGLDPAQCARRMIDAIEARKLEVTIGGKETYGVLLMRFMPGLFARIIRKAKVT